ncbi:hypothetical protein BQ6471_00054 [Vibrio gazogenes]|nr:hypothetical protein BQ6471_00054 [Vibrio gazogenes]
MFLKLRNLIVRQNWEPEAGKVENRGVVIWCAITLADFNGIFESAPETFAQQQKSPKVP